MIWQQLQSCLARLLAARGLAIVHAFPVQLFNSQGCPEEHQLPTFGRSSTLGIVIGNNNALWPVFIQHLAAYPDALSADNPLDDLIEATVTQAVQECCQECLPVQQPQAQQQCSKAGCPVRQQQQEAPQQQDHPGSPHNSSHQHQQHESSSSIHQLDQVSLRFIVRFSHHTDPGKFVNMMRAAQLSGLAYYSNTTHLCMHQEYGPWFALRAVAVIDVDGPDPAAFSQLPCPYPDVEAEAAQQVGWLFSGL